MIVPDCIEKKVTIGVPVSRVWSAISNANEFGAWFGMAFDGPFIAGAKMTGRIQPTTVDAELARLQAPHAGKEFEFIIERIDPPRLFSFRWHPFAVQPEEDYEQQPTTLIDFELQEVEGGTLLTITESGFEQIPLKRRAEAFQANEGGWEHQTRLVAKYLQSNAG